MSNIFKSNIFKFYINNANILNKLYLFIKNKYLPNQSSLPTLPSIEELNTNYNDSSVFLKSDVYQQYFIEDFVVKDLIYIQEFRTKLIFVDNVINSDDTIETMKLKFIQAINENVNVSEDEKICFEEIYMYGLAPSILNKLDLFNNLTNNNKNDLTRKMLINYFKNIDEGTTIIKDLVYNEIYSYDDINAIKITNINEYKSIGQSFIKYYENFIVNPYNYNYETSLTKQSSDLITINNYNMLFEYNIGNTIYVCLASDFFKIEENIDNYELFIKIYFKLLYIKNIFGVKDFITQKTELIKKSSELFNAENFKSKNEFFFLL